MNLKSLLVFMISVFFMSGIHSQKHDYVWHLGYDDYENNPYDSIRGKSIIDFNDSISKPSIYYNGESHINYYGVNATISDDKGSYLFTYNGNYIEDASYNVMMNGSMLSESGREIGDFPHQSGLILPLPESDHIYILFHSSWKWFDSEIGIAGHKLHYSVIDMEKNNGKGAVVSKRNLLIQDTLATGKITSTRHANGRDWWIIIPSYNDDKYNRILLTPDGPYVMHSQKTDVVQVDGLGLSCFSPNGKFYASFSAISTRVGSFLYVYDFDRHTGLLNNPRELQMDIGSGRPGSIAISPSSNILYLFLLTEIFQFDLTSDSILHTKNLVAEVDDYLHPVPGTNEKYSHNFYMSQLGPDGKIYICSYNNSRVLTTVEYPDRWGESCFVNQHSVHIPTFNTSVPNFPNYRLGPIDGSPSDTLGIDNFPLARFRIDQDTLESLKFQFVDLSNYEPDSWFWTFGDGSNSQEIDPVHVYREPGIYEICLEVSNENGTHKVCKSIKLGTTSISSNISIGTDVKIYPNPVIDILYLRMKDYFPIDASIELYDLKGRKVKEASLISGQSAVPVHNLPSGTYIINIMDGGRLIFSDRVIKQ